MAINYHSELNCLANNNESNIVKISIDLFDTKFWKKRITFFMDFYRLEKTITKDAIPI